MNLPFSFQIFGFAVSIAAGFLLGAVYDVFRIWRVFFHTERRAVFFQDVFYMAAAAFFTFLLALAVSCGEVRFYLLAGEALGWFSYYYTVGQVTYRFSHLVSRFLYRYLFDPLGRLGHRLLKIFVNKCQYFLNFIKKIASIAKLRLKPPRKVVYNLHKRLPKGRKKKKGVYDHESVARAKAK